MAVDLKAYPMMDEAEVKAMEALLSELKPDRVLEWGGGGSTLYYAKKYPEIDWVTIEHDPEWATALEKMKPENVTLLKLAFPEYHLHNEKLGRFDLIIVDGRSRVLCLDSARNYLKAGGVVVLHDAGRDRYAEGIAYYGTKIVLSPPKKSKDPRGLYLLKDPKVREKQPECGVMYMAWGDNAIRQADESMKSLWRFEKEMPVLVLGDHQAETYFLNNSKVNFVRVDIDPFDRRARKGFKFLAGRIKPLMAKISPFEKTLYVDADTKFKRSPQPGFDVLDRWDAALAETETRDLSGGVAGNIECRKTAEEIGTPYILYHNSGMIFWRRNEKTMALFDLWSEEWLRYQGWDEQVALLRALLKSEVLFLTLPYTWNCYHKKDAYLVHHWFGGGQARIEMIQRIQARTGKKTTGFGQSEGKLVKIELSPGRWVKCLEGDEGKVRAHYKGLIGNKVKDGS